MTDMTESTELLAFKRQKDGYKVTKNFLVYLFCPILRRTKSPPTLISGLTDFTEYIIK